MKGRSRYASSRAGRWLGCSLRIALRDVRQQSFPSNGVEEDDHTCVSCLSRVCHQCVLVQRARLVVGSLENGSSTHRSLGGRDQREVLARYAQKYLGPRNGISVQELMTRSLDTHIFAAAVLWSVGSGRVFQGKGAGLGWALGGLLGKRTSNRASVTSCQPSAAAGKHGNTHLPSLIDNGSDPLFAATYGQWIGSRWQGYEVPSSILDFFFWKKFGDRNCTCTAHSRS